MTLEWYECRIAAAVGADRQASAERNGWKHRHGFTDGELSGTANHINGAAGEMAFCKAAGIYWGGGIDTRKAADAGRNYQVRTRRKHEYDLIVRDDDADGDIFVLVTGEMPTFTVWGGITGADAKRPEFSRQHGGRPGAYFVPKEFLEPGAIFCHGGRS